MICPAAARVGLATAALSVVVLCPARATGQEPERPEPLPIADEAVVSGSAAFHVTNVAYGPLCRYEDASPDVCRTQRDIRIVGEETCIWVGEERPCTWFGVQFDFENRDPEVPIHCRWDRSHATNDGNYEAIRAKGVTHDEYDLPLEESAGHYFHPMYNLYAAVPVPWLIVTMDFRCWYAGEEILHAPFKLIFSSVFNRP